MKVNTVQFDITMWVYIRDMYLLNWYSCLWSLSIPSENMKKSKGFLVFSGSVKEISSMVNGLMVVLYVWINEPCSIFRKSSPEVFLIQGVLKICSKFTEEHPCPSCLANLLKSPFGMSVLLLICCIFSECLFIGTAMESCYQIFCLWVSRGFRAR